MGTKPVVENLQSSIANQSPYEDPGLLWEEYKNSLGKLDSADLVVLLNCALGKYRDLSMSHSRYANPSKSTVYDIISSLLDHGADPNKKIKDECPLNHARDLKIIRLLLKQGADPKLAESTGNSLLANWDIKLESVKLLLASGASPNAESKHDAPLRFHTDNQEILKLLLEAGADPNHRNKDGKTVLMNWYLDPKSLQVLLECGADPNARDLQRRTPIMYVKKAESVKTLKSFGADLSARDNAGKTVLMNALSQSGQEAKTISALIKAGAPINDADNLGNGALGFEPNVNVRGYWVRDFNYKEPDAAFLELLLQNGAIADRPNKQGETPLMFWAGNRENEECRKIIDLLLKHGADIHRTDDRGMDALMHAAKSRNIRVIKLLFKKKADPTRTSNNGRNCLEWAVALKPLPDLKLVDYLLDGGARINGNPRVRKSSLNLLGKILDAEGFLYGITLLKRGAKINFSTLLTMGVSPADLLELRTGIDKSSDEIGPVKKLTVLSRIDVGLFHAAIDQDDVEVRDALFGLLKQDRDKKESAENPLSPLEPGNWPPYCPQRTIVPIKGVTGKEIEPQLKFTEEEYKNYYRAGSYKNVRTGKESDEEIISNINELVSGARNLKKIRQFRYLLRATDETVIKLWNDVVSKNIGRFKSANYYREASTSTDEYRFILAKFGIAVLPGLLQVAKSKPDMIYRLLIPVSDTRIACLMAKKLMDSPVSNIARKWLMRDPEVAIHGLIPTAVGPISEDRNDCEAALRFIATRGLSSEIKQAAASYAEGVKRSIEEILSVNHCSDYHRKALSSSPIKYVLIADIKRPVLRATNEPLSDRYLPALYGMMSVSTLEDVYPALAEMLELFEPDSLAEFAWSTFSEWENWRFHCLSYLGNDRTVKALIPLIKSWPKLGGMNKAVTGLDILASIGTDFAIRSINAILLKTKYKPLIARASEIMEKIADVRGLTKEQLDDRLIPTLDLNDDGGMTLDFGPREFAVRLNSQLKPSLVGESGKIVKVLPRAAKDDDKQKVKEATARWKEFRADLRQEGPTQLFRMEQAMLTGRRWSGADFKSLLAAHPLLRHVVNTLVWAEYEGKKLKRTFRVDSVGAFQSRSDRPVELADCALVGIPHPLALKSQLQDWMESLARHRIRQAFPQVGRQCFVRKDDRNGDLFGVQGGKAPTKIFRGMKRKGWQPGIGDAGCIWGFYKTLSSDTVSLELSGVVTMHDYGMDDEEQTISVGLPKKLTQLEYSELVRELKELLH